MRNIGKRVGSASQKCARMAGNAILLAFTLVLGFKCWQVCASPLLHWGTLGLLPDNYRSLTLTVKLMKCMANVSCFFLLSLSVWPMFSLVLFTVWECNLQCSKQQLWKPAELHYRPFWHIFGRHSPHVCLCFSFQNCSMHIMQHLVGKVSSKRLKWNKHITDLYYY